MAPAMEDEDELDIPVKPKRQRVEEDGDAELASPGGGKKTFKKLAPRVRPDEPDPIPQEPCDEPDAPEGRTYYRAFVLKGTRYRAGEYVYVDVSDEYLEVARIQSIYVQEQEHGRELQCCYSWMFYSDEAFRGDGGRWKAEKGEVFASEDVEEDHPARAVRGHVTMHFVRHGEPFQRPTAPDHLFCRYVYSPERWTRSPLPAGDWRFFDASGRPWTVAPRAPSLPAPPAPSASPDSRASDDALARPKLPRGSPRRP
eukprot:tig00020960_g16546.t1